MITKNLDYGMYESSNYKLITKKIISNIDISNVSFSYQTQFSYLGLKEHQEYLKTWGIPFCQSFPFINIL